MKQILLSIPIGFLIFLSFSYFLIFQQLPESILNEGYIKYISKTPTGTAAALLGAMIASYFSFTPFILDNFNKLKNKRLKSKLDNEPTQSMGTIVDIITKPNTTKLIVHYSNYKNDFSIDNKVISKRINKGDVISVHYDPLNPKNAYLDLSQIAHPQSKQKPNNSYHPPININNPNTVFKLLEVNPKFEKSNSEYELIGIIHGGSFNGKKVSINQHFYSNELSQFIPGRIFPCSISGAADNYTIQLILDD